MRRVIDMHSHLDDESIDLLEKPIRYITKKIRAASYCYIFDFNHLDNT